ncbi:beta-lactamase-like protein 2 homolog [Wyeomyia smithii]|uniref:beta-lactamase-like protein 2 homolog n=1 Tax=Wyeomyia smithii TaxID=174621 RepID=UPI0024680CBB|nr:beta-lactamase-like protein 2 homolog [Wyeomyia smithii]XP_055548573.1 beta-lactamase-like protein 2 homolog [Wyeomyia smithii]XP_055548574.1 beta-lactamase-like protein 2 homolog [Wyeomyia smithii]XP_055548575.1 beta-lactamase-like protein 2 homolog [Wyeomyia smithii]
MAAIPYITEISSKLIRILGCNPGPMTLQGTNTYIVGSGRKRILIDAGDADVPDYIGHLKQVLRDKQFQINDIIVTHWHHDHLGGVDDVLNAIDNKDSCRVWKYPRSDATESFSKVSTLKNGQVFDIEGAKLEVVHTPGHTTDHVIVVLREEQAVFSGDCILGEGYTVFENLDDYIKSLQVIQSFQPVVIYPGHGNIIPDPMTRISQYIHHRMEREAQIMAVFKKHPNDEFTEMDLVKRIYTDTPEQLWPAAAINVNHHLQKLATENKLVFGGNYWKLVPSSSL